MFELLGAFGLLGISALFVLTIVALVFLFKSLLDKKGVDLLKEGYKSTNPMEKKFNDVNISKYAGVFGNIGMLMTLGLILAAFEMPTFDERVLVDLGTLDVEMEEVIEIPVTIQQPPPPPKIRQPEIIEVPDEEIIEEEIEVELDVEIDEETVVEDAPVVVDVPVVAAPVVQEDVDKVFTIVEESAGPVGGMAAFYGYLGKSIKYPKQARRANVQGKVFAQFVVDKDGSITDIKIMRGIGAGCDEEAIRVLKAAPKWKPAKQRGRPVKQRLTVPISFKLN